MINIVNPNGTVEISQDYFSNLIGYAASSCYGVAGMAASGKAQGLAALLGRDTLSRGVKIRNVAGELVIDLHIIVTYGVNITAIVKSIVKKVSYTVEEATGLTVSQVNVYVDSMRAE